MTSPEAKNLEAISKAIDQHNSNCSFPAAEVRMSPFEVERLGWDQIRGLPVVPDAEIGTGRFRIVCSRDVDGGGLEEEETLIQPQVVSLTPIGSPTHQSPLSAGAQARRCSRSRGRDSTASSAPRC